MTDAGDRRQSWPPVGFRPRRRLDLAELYTEHADFVWRVARRMGVSETTAEDVVHEVFLIVRRRLEDYDGRASFRIWLYGITRGVTANLRRRRQRRTRLTPAPTPETNDADPEHVVAHAEAAAAVERFLLELDPKQRCVFELVDIEGLSGPEAADALGVSVNVVYSRLRLARRHFNGFAQRLANTHPRNWQAS